MIATSMIAALSLLLLSPNHVLALSFELQLVEQYCASTLETAQGVANRLQSEYWGDDGTYTDGELWTDANTLEDLNNLMLATGNNDFSSVADESEIGFFVSLYPLDIWELILGGSNDDAQPCGRLRTTRLLQGRTTGSASQLYEIVSVFWDDTCGGGVWWSAAKTYKNAITNHLYLYTSAVGYLRGYGDTYLQNAIRTWSWLLQSGMRNSQGLWNDGLTNTTCENNNETTWTYNQAVVASGLAALAKATNDPSLLVEAQITLDATITYLTQGGILKESCDDASASTCDADEQIFKGIWCKHLEYFLDEAGNSSLVSKYSPFLGAQYYAVVQYATDASDDVGSVWYAPDQGGSIFSPQSSASGLEAEIAAAKYGPCEGWTA